MVLPSFTKMKKNDYFYLIGNTPSLNMLPTILLIVLSDMPSALVELILQYCFISKTDAFWNAFVEDLPKGIFGLPSDRKTTYPVIDMSYDDNGVNHTQLACDSEYEFCLQFNYWNPSVAFLLEKIRSPQILPVEMFFIVMNLIWQDNASLFSDYVRESEMRNDDDAFANVFISDSQNGFFNLVFRFDIYMSGLQILVHSLIPSLKQCKLSEIDWYDCYNDMYFDVELEMPCCIAKKTKSGWECVYGGEILKNFNRKFGPETFVRFIEL